MDNHYWWACMRILVLVEIEEKYQDHFLFYYKGQCLTSSTKAYLQMGTSLFHSICCHLDLNWSSQPPSADPRLHKLFPLRNMPKALLKLRQIISTMFCLKHEFSLQTSIKVVWQTYLWYISIAFYSIFLLSHNFKNSFIFILFLTKP